MTYPQFDETEQMFFVFEKELQQINQLEGAEAHSTPDELLEFVEDEEEVVDYYEEIIQLEGSQQ